MNDSQDTSQTDSSLGKGIWIVLALILVAFGVYSFLIAPLIPDNKYDPLSALFSGLAFWGVIYAILLQKSELALQRKELELTRGEVRGQKEQLAEQNLTMQQQRFENTFFSLLDLFNGIVNSIEITRPNMPPHGSSVVARGRECFTKFTSTLSQVYNDMQKAHANWESLALCRRAYEESGGSLQPFVGHYFRTLYNIVKFIDASDIENKQMYVNILRAQLSNSELTLLFYNCISKYGSEKFKPLVEKYGLLENMEISTLFTPEHRELFDESAFRSPS